MSVQTRTSPWQGFCNTFLKILLVFELHTLIHTKIYVRECVYDTGQPDSVVTHLIYGGGEITIKI